MYPSIHLRTVSVASYDGKSKDYWTVKGVAVDTYFEVLSLHLPVETEEKHDPRNRLSAIRN
jgi:hypothetical protein